MRDGYNTSFWEKEENLHPVTAKSDFYDVVVVGAGITGISTALELQQRVFTVAILERYDIAFGTTGGTTAHINNFFDTSYDEMIKSFGENAAKTVADNAKKVVPL